MSEPPQKPGKSEQISAAERVALARAQHARFIAKVDRSGGCWLWLGGCDKDGYGKFQIATGRESPKQLHVRAHRIAFEIANGPLAEVIILLHECDTPRCVNPDHLRPGTQADNIADRDRKGRQIFGERHWRAKLSATDVIEIRKRRADGESKRNLASIFGVSEATVWQIEERQTWRHV